MRISWSAFFLAILVFLMSAPQGNAQQSLKVMHYNILMYGNTCGGVTLDDKDVWLKNILEYYQPDIFTVNEMADNIAFANRIKIKALSGFGAMEYGDLTNNASSSIVNMLFYNKDKLGYSGVEVIASSLRDINVYTLYDKASATVAGSDTIYIYCIVAHLKAGSGSSDQNVRKLGAISIMNWIAAHGGDKNYLVMGDFNLGTSTEDAWQEMIANSDLSIRLKDPLGMTSGWSGPAFAAIHTQSTRSSSIDCGSAGGMDDRFDFILAGNSIMNGAKGLTYVPGSYTAIGNDGASYNVELDCSDNLPVSNTICGSLRQMSDHLPVVLELSVASTTSIADDLLPGIDMTILGNPASEAVQVSIKREAGAVQNLHLSILNMLGQEVVSMPLPRFEGENTFRIPTAGITSGLYSIQLRSGSGRGLMQKVRVY